MLRFFRINDPYRLIFIFLILVGVRVAWIIFGLPLSIQELRFLIIGERLGDGFVMYKELYDHTGPLAALVYKWIDIFFGRSRWIHVAISTILVIVQAGLFNNILLRNKAYNENTYVPAFLYVVLFCGTMDFFALTPQLMALTFILFALNHVFRRIDNVVTDELFLYSGIYLGMATFFYLPALIYLVLFLLSLVLFSTAVLRRLLVFLYGSFLIFLVIWAYFFWFEASGDFLFSFFRAGLFKRPEPLITYADFVRAAFFLGPVALLSFTVLFTQRLTTFQQKMQQVMIMLFLGGLVVVLIARDLSTNELVLFIPSVTFFLVYFMLGLRRKIWRYSLPYLIALGLILYPFYWLSQNGSSELLARPNATTITGERLMGIGVPLSFYTDNKLAGPFLDPHISEQKLKGLDYFEEASVLYEVIVDSAPTVIVDQEDVMPAIFYKFPVLKDLYSQEDTGKYRRKP